MVNPCKLPILQATDSGGALSIMESAPLCAARDRADYSVLSIVISEATPPGQFTSLTVGV
jgi:hypothetical protein